MVLVLALLAACGSEPRQLTLAGSSTIQPVMEVMAQSWEASHPGDRIDVQGGGSGVGVSATRSGLAQIGMVSRSLTAEEADLHATPFALDGIALIVHVDNPLGAIDAAQVVSVYTGATVSWAELGGAARPITVVNKEEGRATLELFEKHFGIKGTFTPSAVVIGPNGQAITTVAGNPDAIAYVSIGSAAVAEAEGSRIKRVALEGVAATVENVANGSYPLARSLNLVTKGPVEGLAQEFLDFVLSEAGQALVEEQDFIRLPTAVATTDSSPGAPATATRN